MKVSFFIFIFNFIIFSITPKYFKTPDTITTRLIPISILLEGNFDLNEYFGDPEDYLEDKFIDKSNYKYSEYRIENTKDGKSYFHWGIVTIQNGKFYLFHFFLPYIYLFILTQLVLIIIIVR